MYAAGKIPGGFFKREGRASERATLTARMIDRPIRPLWPKGFRNEVQVICTVLSADMVTPHDILCINGASAALMLSPLPFFGPVGAVRIGRIDGELVVNPTLQQNWEETSLDLIVVGTKDGLTMVEAGADEVPEDLLLEALELAHGEIRKLCEAQEDLRRQAGKAKWLDTDLSAEIESPHGHTIWERIQSDGLRESAAVVERARRASSRRRDLRWTRPKRTSSARSRCKTSLDHAAREAAARRPSKARCASSSRATCGRSPTPSRTRRSSSRRSGSCSSTGSSTTVELPFPVGPAPTATAGGQGQPHEELRQEGGRGDLQGPRPQEDRRRQAAARRPRHRGDPADRGRGRRQPARARLRPVHARPDAGALVAHARHREGGPADRRPLARDATAATCTTTTSRPTRSGRPASCAARSGATSATVRSRSARSRR